MVLLAMTACSTKRGYVEKGNVLFQQGKYEAAAINYRKAIQKDPNYGEAFYRLGLNEAEQGNAGDAYNALFRANQLLSTNTEVKEKFHAPGETVSAIAANVRRTTGAQPEFVRRSASEGILGLCGPQAAGRHRLFPQGFADRSL
jgi:tetratricopeptide (TPR) repeat protein